MLTYDELNTVHESLVDEGYEQFAIRIGAVHRVAIARQFDSGVVTPAQITTKEAAHVNDKR